MRSIKVALSTMVVAMALPASSAMAEGSTALCRSNENPCSAAQRAAGVHGVAGTVFFKVGMTTVLCLSSLTEGAVEGNTLAAPLLVKTEILTWNQCGTNAAHSNCEVSNQTLPLFDILNENIGPFDGSATALGWKLKINCPTLFLNCVYGGAEVGTFLLEAAETLTPKGGYSATLVFLKLVEGGCAKEAEFKAVYEWLEKLWTKS